MNELPSERRFRSFGILTIASVFFLIFIGSLVRSTGAGMGCPDWPKCFGSWVPPTSVNELPVDYKEVYSKKREEKLLKLAKVMDVFGLTEIASSFRNDKSLLVAEDFNVTKTWTEYVNRMVGVFTGFFILLTVFFAIPYLKTDRKIFWLSFTAFILVGLEGYIGASVVLTRLTEWVITIHMVLALIIVGLLIYTVTRSQQFVVYQMRSDKLIKPLMLTIMLVSLIQTLSGTQVRENVDFVAAMLGEQNRPMWANQLGEMFQFHRTFSIISCIMIGVMVTKFRKNFERNSILYRAALATVVLMAVQVFSGKVLDNFGFPKVIQSLHLFLGSLTTGILLFITVIIFSRVQLKVTNKLV